jgi:hypothetical protein
MANGRISGLPALHTQMGRRAHDAAGRGRDVGSQTLRLHAMVTHVEQKRHSFAPPGGLRTNGKV